MGEPGMIGLKTSVKEVEKEKMVCNSECNVREIERVGEKRRRRGLSAKRHTVWVW